MAHHKRKRPKNRRAGCLLCKPWKVNGVAKDRVDGEPFSDHRRRHYADRELEEPGERFVDLRYLKTAGIQ